MSTKTRKSNVTTKRRNYRKKRNVKRKYTANSKVVKFYPTGNSSPLPPRYRCKFKIEFYGYTGSGVGSSSFSWAIKMNSPRLPLNTGFLTGLTPLGSVGSANLQPAGLPSLLNLNMYTRYRVYSSACAIDVISESIQDSLVTTISPIRANVFGNESDPLRQPFGKSYVFVNGRAPKSIKGLKNYIKMHDFVGCSKQAIEDDLSTQYEGYYNTDPTNLFYWNITLNDSVNQTLNNPVSVKIQVVYYVELFGITEGTMPVQ